MTRKDNHRADGFREVAVATKLVLVYLHRLLFCMLFLLRRFMLIKDTISSCNAGINSDSQRRMIYELISLNSWIISIQSSNQTCKQTSIFLATRRFMCVLLWSYYMVCYCVVSIAVYSRHHAWNFWIVWLNNFIYLES